MSADANNYDLQNVECHSPIPSCIPLADTQLQNLIKITKVGKESNYKP